jgi:phosphoglycerate dehydrogenase-like enzyme
MLRLDQDSQDSLTMSLLKPASTAMPTIVMFGRGPDDLPDFLSEWKSVNFRLASDAADLRTALPGAEALLCWEALADQVADALLFVDRLRWLQWPFVGVDRILPLLKDNREIILTNAGGVFDDPIAEYVLALILAMAKDVPATLRFQAAKMWKFRETETVAGKCAIVVGVGGVGRAIGSILRAVKLEVIGVGRTGRVGDEVFSRIAPVSDLPNLLSVADYVIVAAPLTPQTRGIFSAELLDNMRPAARFINVGRGELVDQDALSAMIAEGRLAGAALDVFQQEPLPGSSTLWNAEKVVVSPHMAGDVTETPARLAALFKDNLGRFLNGHPLRNIVDIGLGYAKQHSYCASASSPDE